MKNTSTVTTPTPPVSADELLSLQRQLDEVRANLRLIRERKAEFVLSTDIPLQLVKEERDLSNRIAELEQQIATRSTSSRVTSMPGQKRLSDLLDLLFVQTDLPPDMPLHEKIGNLLMTILGRIGGDSLAVVLHLLALLILSGFFAWWFAQSNPRSTKDIWTCLRILWLGLTILPLVAGFLPQRREMYLHTRFDLTVKQRLSLGLDKAFGIYACAFVGEASAIVIWLGLHYLGLWGNMGIASKAVFWFVMEWVTFTFGFVGAVIGSKMWENLLKSGHRVKLGRDLFLGLGFPLIIIPFTMWYGLFSWFIWKRWQTGGIAIGAGFLLIAWLFSRDSKRDQLLELFVGDDTMKTDPQLTEAIDRHTLAFFIGADLPRKVTGLPNRADLARKLAHRRGLDESLSLVEIAQQVGLGDNRQKFIASIRDKLDTITKPPQPFHRRIVSLVKKYQIKTIITTAYDNLLELTFWEEGVACTSVLRDSDVSLATSEYPTIIYLHGSIQSAESLIITGDDHHNLRRDREKVLNVVSNTLRENVILFLGHDLSTPDFDLLWQEILSQEDRFPMGAYAVWPGLPETDVQMWRDRGIVVLDTIPLGVPDVSKNLSV